MASRALVALGGAAFNSLTNGLTNTESQVRYRAARILGEIADPRALEPLSRLVCQADPAARLEAAKALDKMGDPVGHIVASVLAGQVPALKEPRTGEARRAVTPLVISLSDTNPTVRQRAALVLGQFADTNAAEALVKALQDPDPSVRCESARALGSMGTQHAVYPLLGASREGDNRTRLAAVEGLRHLRDCNGSSLWFATAAGGWSWLGRRRAPVCWFEERTG